MESNKKKILYFVPTFPVLSETFISNEISKLIEFGNLDVTVFSLQEGSGKTPENVRNQTYFERISFFSSLWAFLTFILAQPKKAKKIHKLVLGEDRFPYFSLRSPKNSRVLHFFKGITYAELFKKFQPAHIHVHFLSSISSIAMVAAEVLEIPFSVSAHAKDVFVDGSLMSTKAKKSKFISVCNGNTWKEVVKYANLTKSSGKVRLLFHGVSLPKSSLSEQRNPSQNGIPLIFTLARYVEKKGLIYLIEAAKVLKERNYDFIVKVAGFGPLYNELKNKILQYDLSGKFVLLGTETQGIPNKKVLSYMEDADIYVMPFIQASSGDVDGVPYSSIEAAFTKLPIIATNAGSISDLVTKDTGLIVPQKDSLALADAIEILLNDKDLRLDLGNKVYNKAVTLFDISRNTRELEKLLLQ